MSMTLPPHFQGVGLVNSRIQSNGSLTVSAVTINYNHSVTRSSWKIDQNRRLPTQLVSKAVELNALVKRLSSVLSDTVDLPPEFVALKKTLKQILEITIPCIIEFGSRGPIKLHPDTGLEHELDGLQLLVERYLKNGWLERLALSSGSSSSSGILDLIWDCIWWMWSGKWDVKRFHDALEKSRCRIHDLVLRQSLSVRPGVGLLDQQVEIEDFFGARWCLPIHQCLDLSIFNLALRARFKGGSAEKIVASGEFHAFRGSNIEIINRSEWETTIKLLIELDDSIQLSVAVELSLDEDREKYRIVTCPRCRYKQRISSSIHSNWADCTQCDSRFSLSDNDETRTQRKDEHPALDSNQAAPYKNYHITLRGSSSEQQPQDDNPLKKRKRKGVNPYQLQVLNETYYRTTFPTTVERQELARQLDLTPRSIQIWFQNKRQSLRQLQRQISLGEPTPIQYKLHIPDGSRVPE